MPIVALLALGVVTAYVVSLVGPKPPPATLAPGQLQAVQQAAQQGAQQGAQGAQGGTFSGYPWPTPGVSPMPGQWFEPGFQGQPGASVSGVLVDRGERTPAGDAIVYDAQGTAHVVVSRS